MEGSKVIQCKLLVTKSDLYRTNVLLLIKLSIDETNLYVYSLRANILLLTKKSLFF